MPSLDEKILGKEPKKRPWKLYLLVIILISVFGYFKYGTIRNIDNVRISRFDSKDGKFLVLTDNGAFKNIDSWWHLKTRSADLQGKVADGDIVTLKVYGFRNGLLTVYPNVLDIIPAK